MADRQRLEVEILGRKYTVRSEAGAAYVRDLAAYVERRVREIGGGGPGQDPAKFLALAALDITDELFRLREERRLTDKDAGDMGARLGAMRRLLESVVGEG